jgi:aspartyl-tRNA(Asn)/glutamyl-tRNA(Gln) amidotransferase subunit A
MTGPLPCAGDPGAGGGATPPTGDDAVVIASRVRAGAVTPLAVVEAFQARVEALNPRLNAIVDYDSAEGREQAGDISRRLEQGEFMPLAGVPVVVKDVLWMAGRRVTQGSNLFRDFKPPRDALCVERLRAAGAIILGVGNSSEFACKGNTTNLVYGATRHPHDPELTPGGSSGGCATAVAAGMAPLAVGTDAGGSARRPAAHVGVVGFKPSRGAVADVDGFPSVAADVDTIAPMAGNVSDVAAMFGVMVGADPRDPWSIALGAPDVRCSRALRVAFSPRFGHDAPIDQDVAEAVGQAVERLRAAGWSIRSADPVWPDGASEGAIMPIQHTALAALYGDRWRRDPGLFDPDIGLQIESGLACGGVTLARARFISGAIARALAAFFDPWDLLIGPTTPCVAWPVGQLAPDRIGGRPATGRGHAVFTPFINHALAPAASIPCGAGRDGLPVGLQIVGPRGADARVLRAAAAIETALGPAGRPWTRA